MLGWLGTNPESILAAPQVQAERPCQTGYSDWSVVQVFNEINCRKIRDEVNVFAGIWRSRTFLYIIGITVALQVRSLFPSSHETLDLRSPSIMVYLKFWVQQDNLVWCSDTALLSPHILTAAAAHHADSDQELLPCEDAVRGTMGVCSRHRGWQHASGLVLKGSFQDCWPTCAR